MIDIHTHVLPGIDDGSKNTQMTLEMIKQLEQIGIKHVIATPHYKNSYNTSYESVVKMVADLNQTLIKHSIDVTIYPGQEIMYTRNLLDNLEKGFIGSLNNSKYILVETDFSYFDKQIIDDLYELKIKGFIPIIAHPERYTYMEDDILEKFQEVGCLFQLNIGSITASYGRKTLKQAKKFLKLNIYNFLGTDIHNDSNKIDFNKALKIANNKCPNFIDRSNEIIYNK